MQKTWMPIGLLLLCLLVPLQLAQAKETATPKLVLSERSVDYGEVDEGRTIQHTFKVLNQGSEPLEIRDVKPG